ncbi:hypothetical protein KEM74_002282 [Salmonella enterica]|nr:hypothetical protein [Salmonella enterica]EDA7404690.1 hypothetical protein [Salmonella enterica subsp. enterica serovar Sandiego]EHL6682599.1 hypothetical protein [Salmonella enterica]
MKKIILIICFFSSSANALVYCQASSGSIVTLKGEQTINTGNKGEITTFPLTNLSSLYFPYYVDNYYASPEGYESHAATTSLPSGSESGWRKINDFLEVKLLYQGRTVPYGWTYTGNKVHCNSWPLGSSQNFAWIINKTSVIIRLTKTLVGGDINIPRTELYRQHWAVANSAYATSDMVEMNKYLYRLILSNANLKFPAICKVNSINLNVDFGSLGMNEINMKEVLKSIEFTCDRDSQLTLMVHSTRIPYGNSGEKKVSFGTSLENLDVDAEFDGMKNKGNGVLTPPVSVKGNSTVSIPVKFNLKKRGEISEGNFSADGYIVLYQD